jgi:hypothetical protein
MKLTNVGAAAKDEKTNKNLSKKALHTSGKKVKKD